MIVCGIKSNDYVMLMNIRGIKSSTQYIYIMQNGYNSNGKPRFSKPHQFHYY